MKCVSAIVICIFAAACGSDDKALRSPGPGVSVGAAGAAPTNPLPPPVAIGPQIADPGSAGARDKEASLPNPFGAAGSSAWMPNSGAAGQPGVSLPSSGGAAGSGF